MRISRVLGSLALGATVGATSAWAQSGPYGSPELIRMPQVGSPYAAPGYGVVPVSAYQPAPAPPIPEGSTPLVVPRDASSTAQPPSVVNQMLEQANPSENVPSQLAPDTGGCYSSVCGQYEEAIENADCEAIDTCGPMMADCCYPWFASVRGLVMARNHTDNVWTSFETGNEAHQVLKTNDAETSWEGGGEITFGRRFCCAGVGLELTYWTIGSFSGNASAADVGTPLEVGLVRMDDPSGTWTGPESAHDFYENAQEHRLHRESEIHNLELNLFSTRLIDPCASPLALDWVMGIRWLRFRENLTWDSLASTTWNPNADWGYDNGRYQAHWEDDVQNDLVGFQFGFNADLYFHPRFKLFAAPKFGVYNNHIEQSAYLARGDGLNAVAYDNLGNVLGSYPVYSEEDELSFLTEIDLGVEWKMTRRVSATLGYRLVAVTDVALADNQIPFYLNDIPEVADIDSNNDLILHGAFAGLNFSF